MFAYAAAEGVKLRIDGTGVQFAGPGRTGRGGGRSCSSKEKQNTIKSTAISDGQGPLLRLGALQAGADA